MKLKQIHRKLTQSLLLAGSILISSTTQAAPGTLPKAPLFLSNSVEPNVFLTLDDSGSMDWEHMFSSGTAGLAGASGLPLFGVSYRYFWHPDWWSDFYIIPPADYQHSDPAVTWDDAIWVLRNHNANKIYYNPETTYEPWKGVDSSGNPLYQDADPNAVLRDPNAPGGTTTDLTDTFDFFDYDDCSCWKLNSLYIPAYFTWTDTDGDGVIDPEDEHTLYEIKPSTASYPSGRSYEDELQNYANWFQYYRKREFSAKSAIGSVISTAGATRMGLDMFNDGHKRDLASMTSPADKLDLLDTFYTANSNGGTPARRSLQRVGNYFSSTSGSTAINSVADGGECQQNFNILMTDGFWNGPDPGVGNTDQSASADGGFDGDQDESNDGGNYEDTFSNTLADVAMRYYETDLRGDLANKVPTRAGIDENNQQHLVNFTISFGLTGTLDAQNDDPLDASFNWPNAFNGDAEKVDDLWHAAYNSRGEYLSAQNPQELEAALNAAIEDIAERTATAAAVAINSARLTSESVVYLAQFNSNRWQGNLFAYPIIDLDVGTLATTPKWEANSLLTARDITTDPRSIVTYNGTKGVPFRWDVGKLSSQMVTDLRTSPSGSTDSTAIAEARLEFLRGDRSNEGIGYFFRERPTLLGDLVNSGPVFVGKANLAWPDVAPFPDTSGSRYSDFKNGIAETRKKTVFVGSNDGLLHAFNDDTGEEIFAYAPNILASSNASSGYHYLTDPGYAHNWYVDLTPTLSDVYMNTNFGGGWHTILIGGLRGGGRGLFALDVTDPSKLTEANAEKIVMWEFSSADDPDLGYTYSKPTIALANNGRWVAIFGNGYNDTGDGEAKLFIVDIEDGLNGWQPNDYIEITTGVGTTTDRNGLSTPALADTDGNGTVDRVYAGDLEGNMWVFDLSGSNSTTWGSAFKSGSTPVPLFTTPANQPITAKPVLARHPTMPISESPSNLPNLMVFFGTGQYLVDTDKTNTDVQSFYGVWDQGDDSLDRSQLVEQTFRSGFTNRVLTRNQVDYSSVYGWWFDLPDSGERAVTTPIARRDTVFFNSFVPIDNPCAVGGYGFKFSVDMVTGGSPEETVIDVNRDGEINDDDNEGTVNVVAAIQQDGYLPEPVFIEDLVFTGEVAEKVVKLPEPKTGRFSWQELIK